MAVARKTKAEQELDELLERLPDDYRAEHEATIRQQAGFPSDDNDEEEYDDEDEELEPDTTFEEDWEADLHELNANAQALVDADRETFTREQTLRDFRRTPEAEDELEQARIQAQQDAADTVARQRQIAGNAARYAANSVRDTANRAADRIGNLPTPGGIGILLATVIILLLIIIPVNGQPRLVWLWLVLTGRAKLRAEGEGQTIASTALQTAQATISAAQQAVSASTPGGAPAVSANPGSPIILNPGLGVIIDAIERYVHV